MIWTICFIIAILLPISATAYIFVRKCRRGAGNSTSVKGFFLMSASVFVCTAVLFLPMAYYSFAGESARLLQTVLISVHRTIGVFIVDAEYNFTAENMQGIASWLQPLYSSVVAVVFVLAPILTFGFILSFFKNVSAHISLLLKRSRDIYVFSELNERSLLLARDLKRNDARRAIVFCDVFDTDDERSAELISSARDIGAILFEKDILGIGFGSCMRRGLIYFFITGNDSTETVKQSLGLIKTYGERERAHLYIFSDDLTGDLLLSGIGKYKMKIRRVNETRSLIQRQLYDEPTAIFDSAIGDGDEKLISALIVGLGGYGSEMLKTLTWYCQMNGYELCVNAFDRDRDVESRLRFECPEILSESYNGVRVPGEAFYKVNIHSGISVGTAEFAERIREIGRVSFVLVSLGNDNLNVECAIALRTLFERMGIKPAVRVVVHNVDLCEHLADLKNYRGQSYDLELIGDLESSYSERVILQSAVEREALHIHCDGYGGSEEDFYAYEYNYRSSVASALHNRARRALGVPGADKSEEELTESETQSLMDLEHRRWNAYMRSIGYVFSGSEDPSSRNDLGKMHHNLVCFDRLTDEDKQKDRNVGSVDASK